MTRKLDRGPIVMRITPIKHCNNRRFYRLSVMRYKNDLKKDGIIEDLGSIDPMPNRDNEVLIALNVERIKYYMGVKRTNLTGSVGPILGNYDKQILLFFSKHRLYLFLSHLTFFNVFHFV
jgi:ribosomal protein S16